MASNFKLRHCWRVFVNIMHFWWELVNLINCWRVHINLMHCWRWVTVNLMHCWWVITSLLCLVLTCFLFILKKFKLVFKLDLKHFKVLTVVNIYKYLYLWKIHMRIDIAIKVNFFVGIVEQHFWRIFKSNFHTHAHKYSIKNRHS